MRINIVTEPEPHWVLGWIAKSYAERLPNTTVSTEPDPTADINFYVNYDLFKGKTEGIDIGYFTHKEIVYDKSEYTGLTQWEVEHYINSSKDKAKRFDDIAREVDWCIAMCKRTAELLPVEKTSINLIPPDEQFRKGNLVLGVVGTSKKRQRKRYHWIDEISKLEGVEIKMTQGQYSWNELPDFYREIDYLLILSDNEGGPLPLVEALAMGKPVITSNVGFSDEYSALKYDTLEELIAIIEGLVIKKDAWERSTNDLYAIFKALYEKQRLI